MSRKSIRTIQSKCASKAWLPGGVQYRLTPTRCPSSASTTAASRPTPSCFSSTRFTTREKPWLKAACARSTRRIAAVTRSSASSAPSPPSPDDDDDGGVGGLLDHHSPSVSPLTRFTSFQPSWLKAKRASRSLLRMMG